MLIDGWTVCVPNMDIAAGIARAVSLPVTDSEARNRRLFESVGIWTYKRLHAALSDSMIPPARISFDEGHHSTCGTIRELIALARNPVVAGFTATGFRGTPEQTKELTDLYGEKYTVITLRDCIAKGYTVLPTHDVWPLIDDELIDVTGGEFSVRGCEAAAVNQMDALIEGVSQFWLGDSWKAPITLVLPSVAACQAYAERMGQLGLPTATVVAATKGREALFRDVLARRSLLLQVRAVGEGTDLPLRIMIDAAPTMSPVLWMQRDGRLTRPGGESTYICTNHNLMRHAYLWDGLIPAAQLKKAFTAWPNGYKPSRRSMCRALGLTGFGRFAPETVPLLDGTSAFMYHLKAKTGETELVALLIPGAAKPLYFRRDNRQDGTERREVKPGVVVDVKKWNRGRWRRIESLPELKDAASVPASQLTPGQAAWWERSAASFHLNPDTSLVTGRCFAILPILCDAGQT